MFYNSSIPNAMFVAQNMMHSSFLREKTGDPKANIVTRLQPLPLTIQTKSFGGSISGFFAVFFFSLAYSFIPSSNIMFMVKEREQNVKHQQLVSGVGLMAYWFSNFFIDIAKFVIIAIITVLVTWAYGVKTFLGTGSLTMFISLLVTFGASNTSFTYLLSFYFKSPSSAQIFVFVTNFMFGIVFMMGSFILRLIEKTRNTHYKSTEYLLRLIPIFNFSYGLLNIAYANITKLLFKLNKIPDPWSWHGSLKELIASVIMFFVYSVLIFVVEYWTDIKNCGCFRRRKSRSLSNIKPLDES